MQRIHATDSHASWIRSLTPSQRRRWLATLTPSDAKFLTHHWPFWARPNQLPPPGEWVLWLVLAGRGFGKSRTGAEWTNARAESEPGSHGALIARTPQTVREFMIDGESGLIACARPDFMPRYFPSLARVVWPNGSYATIYSSENPDALRGGNHHWGWLDELAAWKRKHAAFHEFLLTLRVGRKPQAVITTTPRPLAVIKDLMNDPTVAVTRGTSYENRANLHPSWFKSVVDRYKGTARERQELEGEFLEEMPGALWRRAWVDDHRVWTVPDDLVSIRVAIDPSANRGEEGDECGIVGGGRSRSGIGYVLGDVSDMLSPPDWAEAAINLYHEIGAGKILAEGNYGAELVRTNIRTVDQRQAVPIEVVLVNSRTGKEIRADPIASLYKQGKIRHVGKFSALEDELCTWVPGEGKSPNRLDALVHLMTDLMIKRPTHSLAPNPDAGYRPRSSGYDE